MNIDFPLVVVTGEGDRERIQHPFHEHRLKLLPTKTVPLTCSICEIGFVGQKIWGCEENCPFYLHKPCLRHSLPETVQLKHGSQIASWSLYPSSYPFSYTCGDCHRNLEFLRHYRTGGDNSGEFLCVTCCLVRKLIGDDEEYSLQVSKVIRHFFHPCALELRFSPSTTCNACFLNHSHFSYCCKYCDFYLDFECAQLPRVSHVDDSNNQIHHFCHWHPLLPFPNEAIDGETLCQLCESSSSSSSTTCDHFYGCTQCQFYAHKSCVDILPQKIDHPLLDDTVVLLTVPSYVCATCDRARSGLTFLYRRRDYFCVKCTLQFRNEFGVFNSIHHKHLLRLRETDEVDISHCFLCKRECSGWHYKCKTCSFYSHKSCAEFPGKIQHPFHPEHPLTLSSWKTYMNCELCRKPLHANYYCCDDCKFYLDFPCASLLSIIQYQGHPHLLGVVDNFSHDEERCNKCPETLPADSPVLHCPKCNFSLHLECGPLPCRIIDPRHIHPLTFQEYYVEDNDMSDLFACHICEKKREARRPVYLCTDGCFITCEVKCVLREVVASLRGERGVMELDTVYPKVACKMVTSDSCLEGITCSSSGEYVATDVPVFSLKKLFLSSKFAPDSDTVSASDSDSGPSEGIPDLRAHSSSQSYYDNYPYSQKDFMHYIKNIEGIDYDDGDQSYIFSKHIGSYCGGDYLLPNILHSVYNNFFEDHNIFGPRCNLNHDDKRAIVFIICSVLHDMRMIKVVDVSAERIAMWSATLTKVQVLYKNDGIELDSLFKHLARIAEDHYLVRAVDIIENKFSKLCNEKEELSATKERLIRELAETEIKIEDNKERLKRFRAYRYAGAHELKKEYFASLENKWRPCYEC